eukprot:CAMPEP_0119335936 /NCGR_PEP_ID=MMETSP1333-20130426/90708_1 /TAXON_ID=418940 /ORGANISM="Scyphosphaera apsteinii, Strain RCC1455" /LENGTH=167 /DNA_ID=CAMNT_0007346611 /DNA_START=40 /DNA_END=543 /DNA_ORIENTATION=+
MIVPMKSHNSLQWLLQVPDADNTARTRINHPCPVAPVERRYAQRMHTCKEHDIVCDGRPIQVISHQYAARCNQLPVKLHLCKRFALLVRRVEVHEVWREAHHLESACADGRRGDEREHDLRQVCRDYVDEPLVVESRLAVVLVEEFVKVGSAPQRHVDVAQKRVDAE